jgi:hypothetical protein
MDTELKERRFRASPGIQISEQITAVLYKAEQFVARYQNGNS